MYRTQSSHWDFENRSKNDVCQKNLEFYFSIGTFENVGVRIKKLGVKKSKFGVSENSEDCLEKSLKVHCTFRLMHTCTWFIINVQITVLRI